MDNELTSSSSENIRVSLSHRRRRQAIATPSATRSATLEARAATSAGGKGDDIGSDGGGDALVAEVALDAGLGMTWAETELLFQVELLNSDLGTHAFISHHVTRTTSKFCVFVGPPARVLYRPGRDGGQRAAAPQCARRGAHRRAPARLRPRAGLLCVGRQDRAEAVL